MLSERVVNRIEKEQKDAAAHPWTSDFTYGLITKEIPRLIAEIRYLKGRLNDVMLGCEVDDPIPPVPNQYGGKL